MSARFPGIAVQVRVPEVPQGLGGDDPLDEVHVRAIDVPRPHWLLLGLGLSELYEKDSPYRDVSGFGFELALRVAKRPADREAPAWAAALLQGLGRYVFRTGNTFDEGHLMDLGGPIDDHRSAITGVAFREDPALGPVETPNGRVRVLQVVGLTQQEVAEVGEGLATRVLARLLARDAALILDPHA